MCRLDCPLFVMFGFGADQGSGVCLHKTAYVMCISAWRRGCLHTGQRVTSFLRQSVNSKDGTARHAAVYATQAGSLGYVAPLLDQSAEPLLQKLQRQMVLAQPQPAGLNPAAFRYSRNTSGCTCIYLHHYLTAEQHVQCVSLFNAFHGEIPSY